MQGGTLSSSSLFMVVGGDCVSLGLFSELSKSEGILQYISNEREGFPSSFDERSCE